MATSPHNVDRDWTDQENSGSGEDSESGPDMSEQDLPEEEQPPVRLMMVVMLCIFQGYASMVGPLQSAYKSKLGITKGHPHEMVFTEAATFVHWGKFVARLGHNVLLACFTSRQRVFISMFLMFFGILIPPLLVWRFGIMEVWTVFVSYGMAGIGLGVFECTFLNTITPLGRLTKAWAIMGIPLGFGIVNIVGQLVLALHVPVEAVFWYIVFMIPIGIGILLAFGPKEAGKRSQHRQADLLTSLKECNSWLPRVMPAIFAKVVCNFVMENVIPACLYIYTNTRVPLVPATSDPTTWDSHLYWALFFTCVAVGDAISRRIPYCLKLDRFRVNLLWLLLAISCSIAGFCLTLFAVAVLALFAAFLAFWGNGLVYGLSAKYIDRFVAKEHNLAAYSLWCFVGDAGSIAGGTLVTIVRDWACDGKTTFRFQCGVN